MWAAAFALGLVAAGLFGFFGAVAYWLHRDSMLVFKNYGLGDCRYAVKVYDVTEFSSAEDLRLFHGCDYGYMEDEIHA